jgi:uncharacterized membrane protein
MCYIEVLRIRICLNPRHICLLNPDPPFHVAEIQILLLMSRFSEIIYIRSIFSFSNIISSHTVFNIKTALLLQLEYCIIFTPFKILALVAAIIVTLRYVQRDLRGVKIKLKRSMLINYILSLNGTPFQKRH